MRIKRGEETFDSKTHLAAGAASAHDLDPNVLKPYEIVCAIGSRFFGER
jgi:hypothetical protein